MHLDAPFRGQGSPQGPWGTQAASVALVACLAQPVTGTERAEASDETGASRSAPAPRSLTIDAWSLPPLAQRGRTAAPASTALLVGARATPASPGTRLTLQRRRGRSWRALRTRAQDDTGQVLFHGLPAGRYRVVRTTRRGTVGSSRPVRVRTRPLRFGDEFSAGLDPARWVYQHRPPYEASSRSCAAADPRAVRAEGGLLHLGVRLDPDRIGETCTHSHGTSPWLLNAQVATEGTFSYRYGFAAARVRFQRPDGMHGAFWTLPVGSQDRTTWHARGAAEVDVAEFFGLPDTGSGQGVVSVVHHAAAEGQPTRLPAADDTAYRALLAALRGTSGAWWDTFHVYSVEWTPRSLVFRLDGRVYLTLTGYVPRERAFLVLSMLTSNHELPRLTEADMSAEMAVDWVRVWAR